MSTRKNKLSLVFFLLAFFCFFSIALGGEFLHNKIHHHQDQVSHDQCFIAQLQAQVLTIHCAIILALFFLSAFYLITSCLTPVFQIRFNLPYSHAPPLSR